MADKRRCHSDLTHYTLRPFSWKRIYTVHRNTPERCAVEINKVWRTSVIISLLQRKLIYKPSSDIHRTPDELGLPWEWVEFNTSDGLRLSGWFITCENDRGTLIFCHGNNGNISNRIEVAEIYHRLGFNVLLFDYRGFGRNDGRPNEKGTYRDVDAAWRYITEDRGITPERIVISGKSLGGPIAAWCAAQHTSAALIIESTFTSMHAIGIKLYPWLPVRALLTFSYNTREYLRHVKCPVLIVHSVDDQLIPFSHGENLFRNAPEPKEFLRISGPHGNGYLQSGQEYIEGVEGFLNRHYKK